MPIKAIGTVSAHRLDQLQNPERTMAHQAVAGAMRRGVMRSPTELPCARCQEPAAEYHHWKGYSPQYWLDVQPLCVTCHGFMHREPQPPPRVVQEAPSDMAKDELLLIHAADTRGIPRRTLYHAAERGALKARQLGRIWVTTLKAVDEWIAHGNHQRGRPKKRSAPSAAKKGEG